MSKPGALLFDMDGVVVHSNPVHVDAWTAYNRRFGVETTPEMIASMYGKRNDEIIRGYLGSDLTDAEVFEHGRAKERLYRELMEPQLGTRILPGLPEFLERHRAIPMGLATNAERENVDLVLPASGLARYFGAVVDGGQVARPKPYPDIYLKAAELLGVAPAHCVVFEDSYTGIAAGRGAGMRVVAVRTTHDFFKDADFVIDDFHHAGLEAWLDQQ